MPGAATSEVDAVGKKNKIIWLWPVLAAVAVTLVTGLYDGTPAGLLGAIWYGLPFTWIRRLVMAPQYFPWGVDVLGLAADVVFWTIAVAVLSWLARRATNQ